MFKGCDYCVSSWHCIGTGKDWPTSARCCSTSANAKHLAPHRPANVKALPNQDLASLPQIWRKWQPVTVLLRSYSIANVRGSTSTATTPAYLHPRWTQTWSLLSSSSSNYSECPNTFLLKIRENIALQFTAERASFHITTTQVSCASLPSLDSQIRQSADECRNAAPAVCALLPPVFVVEPKESLSSSKSWSAFVCSLYANLRKGWWERPGCGAVPAGVGAPRRSVAPFGTLKPPAR